MQIFTFFSVGPPGESVPGRRAAVGRRPGRAVGVRGGARRGGHGAVGASHCCPSAPTADGMSQAKKMFNSKNLFSASNIFETFNKIEHLFAKTKKMQLFLEKNKIN